MSNTLQSQKYHHFYKLYLPLKPIVIVFNVSYELVVWILLWSFSCNVMPEFLLLNINMSTQVISTVDILNPNKFLFLASYFVLIFTIYIDDL